VTSTTIQPPKPRQLEGFSAPEGFVRVRELANMMGISKRTLRRWEAFRQGPPKIKIGRQIYYRLEAVNEWLVSREQRRGRKGASR